MRRKSHLRGFGQGGGKCSQHITDECLASVRVLWREPDSMRLWGLPYRLRMGGQTPYHLYKAHRDWQRPLPGHYGPKRINLSDWIPIPEPGSHAWEKRTQEERRRISRFLAVHGDCVPQGPVEYAAVPCGAPVSQNYDGLRGTKRSKKRTLCVKRSKTGKLRRYKCGR